MNRSAEPLDCGVCGSPGAPARLVDLAAEAAITGRSPAPGQGYVHEGRCENCWRAYRQELDRRADARDAAYRARRLDR